MYNEAGESMRTRVRLLVRSLLFMFGCAVVLAFAGVLAKYSPVWRSNLTVAAVSSAGALFLTMIFARWDGIGLTDVGAAFNWRSLPRFAFGWAVGSALVAAVAGISLAAGHVQWQRIQGSQPWVVLVTLLTYVALSCREELSFRGYPLRRLETVFGVCGSQIFVALIFALEHVVGGWGWRPALLGAGVGSLLFGMAAISTRGLAVPIGIHGAWNFGDWIMGGKDPGGLWRVVAESGFEQQAAFVRTAGYVAVMAAGTFCFWMWHRRRNAN
jgi:uncharacterized protein